MIALIQRVSRASVTVEDRIVGRIGRGLLALIAVQPDDDERRVRRMVERVLTYRVFPDAAGRMNESLLDQKLALLAVPQFTLAADTGKGTRPSFTRAAAPDVGLAYFETFVKEAAIALGTVETGEFAADMQVELINDGPVTFWLQS